MCRPLAGHSWQAGRAANNVPQDDFFHGAPIYGWSCWPQVPSGMISSPRPPHQFFQTKIPLFLYATFGQCHGGTSEGHRFRTCLLKEIMCQNSKLVSMRNIFWPSLWALQHRVLMAADVCSRDVDTVQCILWVAGASSMVVSGAIAQDCTECFDGCAQGGYTGGQAQGTSPDPCKWDPCLCSCRTCIRTSEAGVAPMLGIDTSIVFNNPGRTSVQLDVFLPCDVSLQFLLAEGLGEGPLS